MYKQEDAELVIQLQKGSLEALGKLYISYRQMVFRTTLAITGDYAAASDLLQDVFLRLYRFADHIDPSRPLEPWLYRMSVNLSYTWIKRSRRFLQPLEDLADWLIGPVFNSPLEATERSDDWEQVQRAVARLPLSQRAVVVMYYLNDLSLQEISEIMEIPVGTVKSRLHYGRRSLQKSLGVDGDKLPDFNYEGL